MTLLLALLLASSIALADGLESSDARSVGERPDPAGQPTLVTIDAFIFDIDAIDDAVQRFELDIFVNISWQDSRLALPVEEFCHASTCLHSPAVVSAGRGYTWVNIRCKSGGLVGQFWMQFNSVGLS